MTSENIQPLIDIPTGGEPACRIRAKVLVKDKKAIRARKLIALWNRMVQGTTLPPVSVIDSRVSKTVCRLREHPEKEYWVELFKRIRRTTVLHDRKECSWFCFDWLVGWLDVALSDEVLDVRRGKVVHDGPGRVDPALPVLVRGVVALD